MRTIPSGLLDKIERKLQVPSQNAEPKLKVLLSKGFFNELFQVFTIQEGDYLTDVDVAVKRLKATEIPAEAYAFAINEGVAQVKSKPLPYDDQTPWIDEFTVDSGIISVAIEFDGYWDRDIKTKKFNFITEANPWLFYVKGGSLYAKYWQEDAFVLSTGVSKVCAIRGWVPTDMDYTNDQGLIIMYLKTDGTTAYRNYCSMTEGYKAWEYEKELSQFVGTVTDIALFRTNDFRVGFIAQTNNNIWWSLTTRNYAGMSFFPELLSTSISEVTFNVIPITYTDSPHDEYIKSSISKVRCYIVPFDAVMEVVNVVRLGDKKTVEIEFNHTCEVESEIYNYLKVRDVVNTEYSISTITTDTKKLIITTESEVLATRDLYIEMSREGDYILGGRIDATGLLDYSEFSILAKGVVPEGHHHPNITVNMLPTFEVTSVEYLSAYGKEYIEAEITSITLTVTKIGSNPL